MSVDYYSCEHCGDTFCDCGDYISCDNCEGEYCVNCEDDVKPVRDDDGTVKSCAYCRGEIVSDGDILIKALELLGKTKEEVIEIIKKK